MLRGPGSLCVSSGRKCWAAGSSLPRSMAVPADSADVCARGPCSAKGPSDADNTEPLSCSWALGGPKEGMAGAAKPVRTSLTQDCRCHLCLLFSDRRPRPTLSTAHLPARGRARAGCSRKTDRWGRKSKKLSRRQTDPRQTFTARGPERRHEGPGSRPTLGWVTAPCGTQFPHSQWRAWSGCTLRSEAFVGAAREASLWAGSPEWERPPDRDRPKRRGDPPAPMRCWGPAAWGLTANSHGGSGIRLEGDHGEP